MCGCERRFCAWGLVMAEYNYMTRAQLYSIMIDVLSFIYKSNIIFSGTVYYVSNYLPSYSL